MGGCQVIPFRGNQGNMRPARLLVRADDVLSELLVGQEANEGGTTPTIVDKVAIGVSRHASLGFQLVQTLHDADRSAALVYT